VTVRPDPEGPAAPQELERDDAAWLRGECKVAVRFIVGNALVAFLFMAIGGLVGHLAYGRTGMIAGAVTGLVLKLLF
jgi:hypothetical protein